MSFVKYFPKLIHCYQFYKFYLQNLSHILKILVFDKKLCNDTYESTIALKKESRFALVTEHFFGIYPLVKLLIGKEI